MPCLPQTLEGQVQRRRPQGNGDYQNNAFKIETYLAIICLLKKLGSIWMTAMQEEMGNAFTNDVRDVWKKAVMAVIEYASK
jgi:hypothetical protein